MQTPISIAKASGKIILFGEHAVVYGQPSIAVPLSAVYSTAKVFRAEKNSGFRIVIPRFEREFRFLESSEGSENGLVYTARLVLQKLNMPEPDLIVELESNIPQKSGFGSGAAVSASIARALFKAFDADVSQSEINDIVYEVEKLHHGTPSGIDNTVIAYERPLYFVRNRRSEFIKIAKPFDLLVVRLPHSTPTKVTVSDVRFLNDKHPRRVQKLFNRIGEYTRSARAAIENGMIPELGPLMNDNHRVLRKLTVSDTITDRLCRIALKNGAYGAKLSGGGRGGNMIVLPREHNVGFLTDIMLQNGAAEVIHTRLS